MVPTHSAPHRGRAGRLGANPTPGHWVAREIPHTRSGPESLAARAPLGYTGSMSTTELPTAGTKIRFTRGSLMGVECTVLPTERPNQYAGSAYVLARITRGNPDYSRGSNVRVQRGMLWEAL